MNVGDAMRGCRVLEERGVSDQRPATSGARADMSGRTRKPAQALGRRRSRAVAEFGIELRNDLAQAAMRIRREPSPVVFGTA